MRPIIITGNGTDVGKTILSAIVVTALEGDYWKPVQHADDSGSDSETIRLLVPVNKCHIHPPAYNFKAPLSPHHAARLENIYIDPVQIIPPETSRPLIIETVGGIFVPFNNSTLAIDLFDKWNGIWIVISRHYLGSINHSLLTVEALKKRNQNVKTIIFNGSPNTDSEKAILQFSGLTSLGRLLPEEQINQKTIKRYANQWKTQLKQLLA